MNLYNRTEENPATAFHTHTWNSKKKKKMEVEGSLSTTECLLGTARN